MSIQAKDLKRGWTDLELKAINAESKGKFLSDGRGLFGRVRLSSDRITIEWNYAFKWQGKKQWFYCGSYPTKSISEIREERDNAKQKLKEGRDPRIQAQVEKIENYNKDKAILAMEAQRHAEGLTVRDLFNVWISDGVHRKDGNKIIKSMFENHILPSLGNIEIRQLTEKDLLNNFRHIAKTKKTTAFEVFKDTKQMLAWAEKRQPWRKLLSEGNPAALVEKESFLPKGFAKERDRVLSHDEIRNLKNAFEFLDLDYIQPSNKNHVSKPVKKELQLAMWICLSTLCRIGELMKAEWKDIDFHNRTWFIPAKNSKGIEGKKTDHTIYLSDFSIEQFKKLQEISKENSWLFPASNKEKNICESSYSKQIGDRQLQFKQRTKKLKNRTEDNTLVIGQREWTPHDLRRTGATILQSLYNAAEGHLMAELCLHHSVLAGAAKHYLLHDHKDAMKQAWQKLGERIELILNSNI